MHRFASVVRKVALALTLVGAFAVLGQSQTTNVTATVTHSAVAYGNGTYLITFVPNSQSGLPSSAYRLNGSTFTQSFSGSLDASGVLSVTIGDNAVISPSGSSWLFRICSLAGNTCFTYQGTVTGASQSLTTALSNASLAIQGQTQITSPTSSTEPGIQGFAAGGQSGVVWSLKSANGTVLFSVDGSGNVVCAGTGCGGGGGGGPAISVNGTPTTSQSLLNFVNSSAFNGVTLTFTNPALGNIQAALSGTFNNAALANSSVTINTAGCLGGGGSLALGGTLSLTSTTCLTTSATLASLASSTSAQLAGLLSDETGTGLAVFNASPTFATQITTPIMISTAGDPADSGAIRLGNGEVIGWERNPTGTDATLGVDTSNILQSSVQFNATVLTEGGSAVPNSTDNLGFFASTTSAQLKTVLSDETGSGTAVFNTTPTLVTPVINAYTVGTLPAAGTANREAIVTDGVDTADCTSGGGTTRALCLDTGAAWVSVSGAGSAGANTALSNLASTAVNASVIPGSDNAVDLGSASLHWRSIYFATSLIGPTISSTGTNGGLDGTEGTGVGLTPAVSHDLLYPDSTAHRWVMNNNNGGANTVAGFLDKLSVFAATTSAELAGVISDETGSGKLTFATAPTFITSITTPVLISTAGDPADAGVIRLGNAETIAWEANPTGTDLTETVTSSNVFSFSAPVSVTTGFQIGGAATLGHYLRGNGTNYVDSAVQASDLPAALSSSTSVNGTSIPSSATLSTKIASGTLALGTSSIASTACATVVTSSATGVATTDPIIWAPNADITGVTGYTPATAGSLIIYIYPTANNVNAKVCNPTSSSITPGAVTLNYLVVR